MTSVQASLANKNHCTGVTLRLWFGDKSQLIKIIDEGIHSSCGKPVVFLEGEADHRLPIHDQALRLTGAFKALGKMIGHSILHGGPGLHGLSLPFNRKRGV